MDIKKLSVRAISGAVYVAVIVGCIMWGTIPFSVMAALFASLGIIEFEKITHELTPKTFPTLLLDIAGAVCLSFSWMIYPVVIWIFVLLCRMTLELYIKSDSPLADLAHSLMSQLYIGLPIGIMTTMGYITHMHIILAIFLMIWINDTGAFLVGSSFGRHRLFERISPKKSWEGFFGGLAFNIIAGALFFTYGSHFFGMEGWRCWQAVILGVVVTIFATWGDLVESMIKRNLNIKDSGNLIPGHGGILDRIDSLLFVMPASFIYLLIMRLA